MLKTQNEIARDERITTYLMPTEIKKTWGVVQNSERLLKEPRFLQINIPEPDVFTLENGNSGENAAILLDFGRELQGGIRLLISEAFAEEGAPELLLRFGESCAEALTPLCENNATNDHALRDFSIFPSSMSDQTFGETGFRFVYLELKTKNAKITF